MEKIAFLGCGSWGGALGSILADKNFDVTMWHRNKDVVSSLNETRQHYLIPELTFPKNIHFTSDMSFALRPATIVVFATPSQSIRKLITEYKSDFNQGQLIVNVAKGIEIDTLLTVSEVINDVLGDNYNNDDWCESENFYTTLAEDHLIKNNQKIWNEKEIVLKKFMDGYSCEKIKFKKIN